MPLFDTDTIAYQFKRVYGEDITDLFARHTMTYNQFESSKRTARVSPGGAGFYFSLRQGDAEGVGGRAQNALLPEPLPGDGVQGVITPKLLYAVIRMSGLAMEAGKGDAAAFVNALVDATSNAYKALTNDMNRQCHGDGYGLLGTTSAAATPSTTVTWEATFDNDRGVRYMKKGMICDFFQSTAIDQTASSVRISSIDPVTKIVTFEAAADAYRAYHPVTAAQSYSNSSGSVASGSFLVRYGARAATHATTNASYELTGLNGMYDDGTLLATFEGVTVSSDPEFKANILSNSDVNRELTEDLMLAAMDMSAARSSAAPDLIRMGLGQRRKYFGLFSSDRRFAPSVFKGGYETLGFSQNQSVDILVDPVTQPNRIYFEPKKAIKKYTLTEIGWGGFDPNKMHWRQDYDQATMFLRTYANLGVEERQSLTLLDDLTEPSNTPF
ncbi:MAG: phage major capsid protein [Candidatus Doudnabacteria bacterium]|nr:phage major capsid protein [Desulfobacterales bacterium]MDZ4243846.1 phage major capsid protein [Candidatus Doudnabacteria bacterium]